MTSTPPRRQHTPELGEHRRLLGEMLDRLERHDEVDGVVGKRQRGTGAADIAQVRGAVARLGMGHGLRRDVDADDVPGPFRQQEGAVAFAARRIQHPLAARERRDDAVAMPVLVPYRAFLLGREPLPGEREGVGGGGGQGGGGEVVRRDRAPCASGAMSERSIILAQAQTAGESRLEGRTSVARGVIPRGRASPAGGPTPGSPGRRATRVPAVAAPG